MPSYSVSFPDIEVNAIHGKEAIEKAIEELKTKQAEPFSSLPAYNITWTETHDAECDCDSCQEE